MARLNNRASTVSRRDQTPDGGLSPSPSPTPPSASFSSDKENRSSSRTTSATKRPLGDSAMSSVAAGKRRKLAERGGPSASGTQSRRENMTAQELQDEDDKLYYDPAQDPQERREVRAAMRNANRDLNDRREQIINGDGTEIIAAVNDANSRFRKVKQTADATIDARTLITASELNLQRGRLDMHGGGNIGIDVDEFVSKCASFMMNGRVLTAGSQEDGEGGTAGPSTQGRRRRTRNADDDDDDNDGDAYDWHVLGSRVCFPSNKRPTVPSFLLGPLSVEKKVRATQRRATQRRDAPAAVSRPQEIKAADLERNENSNLTSQCKSIRDLLQKVMREGEEGVTQGQREDMDESDAKALFSQNNLAMNWQVPLLKFALNPHSFGQTIENLFYISFLVRDGYVKIETDDETGFPTMRYQEPKSADEARSSGGRKNQAILSMTQKEFDIFRVTMNVREPIIPHRAEESQVMNGRGWYG